jgi:tRNA U34 5-carboxymethylaminomethyl modifying enzyme MnmG/GidA
VEELGGKKYIMKKVRLTEKDLMRSVRKTINEESKGENYMFFSNLKQMRRQLDIMINEFDHNMVNDTLNNGHDWADDHITEAKVNIDQVFDFFMNKLKDEDGEYKDDEEFEFPVDDDYDDTEDYYTSHDKYGNSINDYPK